MDGDGGGGGAAAWAVAWRSYRQSLAAAVRDGTGEGGVVSVAIGRDFTLVATEAGAVYSFGSGSYGCLGHGDRRTTSTRSASRRWMAFAWSQLP